MLPKKSVGAEIGVWTGKFTRQILAIVQPKEYHLIDPWEFMPQYPNRWYGGSSATSQKGMNKIFASIMKEFSGIPGITIHRLKAAKAADRLPQEHFDWVYIDGDHSYKEVKRDIQHYYPLIKPDGLLCGDDWQLPSIRRAVTELLSKDHKINNHTFQWWIRK